MPDRLYEVVARRTTIENGYRQHAAPGGMRLILADWRIAALRLQHQITELERMATDRENDPDWPPSPTVGEHGR